MFFDLWQNSMTYYPEKAFIGTPENFGAKFEDLTITTEDQENIHGWFIPSPTPSNQLTILFFHGNAGNISGRSFNAVEFSKMGVNVLIIDYRGYGKSTGKPSERGLYKDALAAYKELTNKKQIPPKKIILFGRSLGAGVATQLATQVKIGKLILESPFTNTLEVGESLFPKLPLKWVMKNRYNSLAKIKKITVPKLIIHGTRDTIIPFELGKKLFDAAIEPKEFYSIKNADHNNTLLVGGKAYWDKLREFIQK